MNWQVGQLVEVGFVSGLTVVAKMSGGEWLLENRAKPAGSAVYSFTARRGLRRI
jgi:hypothetical protein